MNVLILQASPRAKGNTAWMAEEYKNAPAKVKKMALLCSSYSPGVYDGATAEAKMDYYDLNPTPPVFKHFDLISGEVSDGFVGDRFSKVTI